MERVVFHHSTDRECESHYRLGRTLGQGSFATVKLATEMATETAWAVKIIKKSALTVSDAEALKSEMTILQQLQHTNIVGVHEIFDAPHFCYIVMECMFGGELFDRIVAKEHYSELEARIAVLQLLSAVDYCHDQNVVHRDIKPENLLYATPSDDAVLKLCDFGLAKLIKDHELLHNQCGTPGYVAPEVLTSTSRSRGYGPECDMWSCGVIVFILLCGYPPFYDDDNEVLFSQIARGEFEFASPFWDDVGTGMCFLVALVLFVHMRASSRVLRSQLVA